MSEPGFPSTLSFELKKNAVASTMQQIAHFPITSSTASPLDTITFSLSCGKYGQYLSPTEIYLSFNIANLDGTSAITIDHSAYSFIDRIQVQSSGVVISDLQYFAPYAALMLDSQVGTGKGGFMSAFAGSAVAANANVQRAGATIAPNGNLNVSLPLIGTAIDGSSSDKMIPVGALSDLQVIIYINSTNAAVTAGAAITPWRLSNLTLTCSYVTLDAGAQAMINREYGGEYKWSGELWKGYNFNLATGSTADNVIVPIKVASAKSLVAILRPAASMASISALTNSSRICPYSSGTGTSSFFATIGSDTIPGIPIKNTTQHAVEFLKMWHGLGNPQALVSQFDSGTWTAGDSANAALCGTFAAGLDLECYSNKTNTIHSGYQIIGGTTLILNQSYAAALAAATLQTTYVHYDAIYTVSDGKLMVAN